MGKEFEKIVISSQDIAKEDLKQILYSLKNIPHDSFKITKSDKSFWESLDTAVTVSIITGTSLILSAFVNGIFNIIVEIAKQRNKQALMQLNTTKGSLNITSEDDLPDEKEFSERKIIEMRLFMK